MMDVAVDLVRSGRIADIALAVVAIEAILLGVTAIVTGQHARLRSLPHLAAGACLLLSLKAALIGGPPTAVLGWLAGALVANLIDMPSRWRG